MAKIKYDRARIMNEAQIFEMLGVPFSTAMRTAWKEEKLRVLRKRLRSGIVEITLQKASGRLDKIFGTTKPDKTPTRLSANQKRSMNVWLYDTEKNAWRVIKKDAKIISIK